MTRSNASLTRRDSTCLLVSLSRLDRSRRRFAARGQLVQVQPRLSTSAGSRPRSWALHQAMVSSSELHVGGPGDCLAVDRVGRLGVGAELDELGESLSFDRFDLFAVGGHGCYRCQVPGPGSEESGEPDVQWPMTLERRLLATSSGTCVTRSPSAKHHASKFFTTYRGLITAAAPRSLALKRTTMSWLKSASLFAGDCVTVIGQFSM